MQVQGQAQMLAGGIQDGLQQHMSAHLRLVLIRSTPHHAAWTGTEPPKLQQRAGAHLISLIALQAPPSS